MDGKRPPRTVDELMAQFRRSKQRIAAHRAEMAKVAAAARQAIAEKAKEGG